jgi:hypothetical protein
MITEPQQAHAWLAKLVGQWDCEGESEMEPGKPTESWKASETVRAIGGLWIQCEGKGEMPDGGPSMTLMTLGYDTRRERYVGTFIASMMSYLWVYEGTLDGDGRVLTLDTVGPDLSSEGKLTKYQDVIELVSDDQRVLRSRIQGADGQWRQIMTVQYRRQK